MKLCGSPHGEAVISEITVRQLEYFIAVVDHGSMSASARELHISQAAISVAVRQLEKSLNAKLLSRAPARRAQPTPAGQALLPYARRVVGAIMEGAEAVRNDFTEIRGTLRVSSSLTVSPHVLPPLLAHFARHHPEVNIRISEAPVADIHHGLHTGEIDLGLVYARQTDGTFPHTVVEAGRQHVMLSATHRWANRQGISLREIVEEPLILVDIPPSVDRVTQLLIDLGLRPNIRWASSNFETVRSLVAYDLGWSFVNVVPSSRDTYDGKRVSYVPITDDIPPNPIVAMVAEDSDLPGRVQEALDFFRVWRHGRKVEQGPLPRS